MKLNKWDYTNHPLAAQIKKSKIQDYNPVRSPETNYPVEEESSVQDGKILVNKETGEIVRMLDDNTDLKFDERIVSKAKQVISVFTLALCEDCIASKLGTAQLVPFNLLSNFTLYGKENGKEIVSYLTEKRDRHSRAKHIAKDIFGSLSESDREEVFMISEKLIKNNVTYELGVLTSENIIELYKESEHPKTVFVVLPEQDSFLNGYAALFLAQAYSCNTEMREAASRRIFYKKPDFVKPNYFIMNGYRNLPDIDFNPSIFDKEDDEHKLILVGKSCRQLFAKYGTPFAEWMKYNCMLVFPDDYNRILGERDEKSNSGNSR